MPPEMLPSDFERNPGAFDAVISAVEKSAKSSLPSDYRSFLLSCNGGEGFIGKHYVILWKAEELIPFNTDYQTNQFAPGIFLIGSNGAGEAYGFDLRVPVPPFIRIPFIGMALEHVRPLAKSFSEFVSQK